MLLRGALANREDINTLVLRVCLYQFGIKTQERDRGGCNLQLNG